MEPGTTINNVAEQGLVPIRLSIEIATKPWLFSAENMKTGDCLCSGSSIYVSYRLDVTWKLNKSEGSTGNVNEAAFTLIIYLVMRNDMFYEPWLPFKF